MTTRGGGLPRNVPQDILIDVINRLMARNVGRDVTLTLNAISTTLIDERVGPNSFIGFMPQSQAAAGAQAGLWPSARTKGSATLSHATASATLTYTYIVLG